jgi:hypothetical protein
MYVCIVVYECANSVRIVVVCVMLVYQCACVRVLVYTCFFYSGILHPVAFGINIYGIWVQSYATIGRFYI